MHFNFGNRIEKLKKNSAMRKDSKLTSMTKTHQILIFGFIILFTSCYKPPTQKKVTKSPVYTFKPKDNIKELEPGFFIEITKIDPSDLNQETYEASLRFSSENELFTKTTIEKDKTQNKKEGKFLYEKAFAAIDWLENQKLIDHNLAIELKLSYSPDHIFTENIGLTNAPTGINQVKYRAVFNPYRANKFTMFKVQVENESYDLKKIHLSNFIISSGYEQLVPLSIKYFDTIFSPTSNEYQNILRFNMPNELIVPPSQKVIKYLAVPIIDEKNPGVTLTLLRDNSFQSFNFQKEILFQGGIYNYIFYKINPKTFFTNPNITVVVKFENNLYSLDNPSKLWIYENDVDKPIDIYCFCEFGREFEFGKIENLKLPDHKNHVVDIRLKSYKQ